VVYEKAVKKRLSLNTTNKGVTACRGLRKPVGRRFSLIAFNHPRQDPSGMFETPKNVAGYAPEIIY
jgi:hypothetical protein